ncbi:hypothetical protein BH10ACI1_BH10ACI1_15100 [soil metagenome]
MKNQIIISLFLLAAFCVAPVFAQEKSKEKIIAEYTKLKEKLFASQENQCEMYDKANFSGKPISLNIVNADIRDVLKEITKQIGVEFEIDKSVGQVLITATVNDSWNSALNWLLESYGLEAQKQCPVLRIVKSEKPLAEKNIREIILETSPLYTEVIKLKNLKLNYILPNNSSDFYERTFDENTRRFVGILNKVITCRGSIEIAFRENCLVITDFKERVELISNFVKLLDDSGLTLEELVGEPAFEIE